MSNGSAHAGLRILLVGESCVVHTVEHKGYDSFASTRYNEPAMIIKEVIEQAGHSITHLPCHRVHLDFPGAEALARYDVVLFSDVGANTLLLHPDTARFCRRTPNKLRMIADYVDNGGGFGMIGGYMTFSGIEGKGKYKDTVIEDVLPVNLLAYDDRVEVPEGADLACDPGSHTVLAPLPQKWPFILGYNRVVAKPEARVIVSYGKDPIIALGSYGKGRSMAYATDCAPHWAPPEMYQWEHYGVLWDRLLQWLAGKIEK